MTTETETSVEEEHQEEVLLPDTTIVTHCIYKNDLDRLVKSFEDDTDPYKESINELINERDEDGKSPLDLAASFGRVDICRELLKRGADLTSTTEKGYYPLHHGAAWGRVGVLKALVEFNANLQQRNKHGERPRETAARYNQRESVDYLDWAEAKVNLVESIRICHEAVTDPEKGAGRVTKDEKSLVVSSCKENTEWLELMQEATTQDFISHRHRLEEIIAPIMLKLSEPHKHEKK
ncbi:ankyrin repeat domain-containing protein 45-like isoform X2 [Littorina saxatilis]|uniref:Ankyrin repeat domain-containing protein 45 n=1 Tax=Littorina saxatilis TaxID=31220 RepID=A0AAN9AX86_9CAEN